MIKRLVWFWIPAKTNSDLTFPLKKARAKWKRDFSKQTTLTHTQLFRFLCKTLSFEKPCANSVNSRRRLEREWDLKLKTKTKTKSLKPSSRNSQLSMFRRLVGNFRFLRSPASRRRLVKLHSCVMWLID